MSWTGRLERLGLHLPGRNIESIIPGPWAVSQFAAGNATYSSTTSRSRLQFHSDLYRDRVSRNFEDGLAMAFLQILLEITLLPIINAEKIPEEFLRLIFFNTSKLAVTTWMLPKDIIDTPLSVQLKGNSVWARKKIPSWHVRRPDLSLWLRWNGLSELRALSLLGKYQKNSVRRSL